MSLRSRSRSAGAGTPRRRAFRSRARWPTYRNASSKRPGRTWRGRRPPRRARIDPLGSWFTFQTGIVGFTTCEAALMDTLSRIEQTLDTLRPYIASHRGQVEVVDFDEGDGTLLLRLGGTCHGCSASTVTLRQGIEARLRDLVPEVKHVEAV